MRMRILLAASALTIALGTTHLHAQELDLPRSSPKASVTQIIGTTDIAMSYSSPGVKGRVIWGDLVPYDEVWRSGANEATTFTTSHDIMIDGKNLPAGKYALFTVPGKESWDVVWNTQADQWGSGNYDTTQNVLRIQVMPKKASDHVERLNFVFRNFTTTEGELVLEWERLQLPIPIKVSLNASMESVNAAMANYDGEKWQTPYQCASFYFDNDLDMDKAMEWAEMSVGAKETYFNARLMAMMLAKAGKREDAIKWGEKAVELGKARENPIDTRPVEKLVAEWRGE